VETLNPLPVDKPVENVNKPRVLQVRGHFCLVLPSYRINDLGGSNPSPSLFRAGDTALLARILRCEYLSLIEGLKGRKV